jgi:hypothetical protein
MTVNGGSAGTGSGWVIGGKFNSIYSGAGNVSLVTGGWFVAETAGTGSGTISEFYGGKFTPFRGGTSNRTITSAAGISVDNATSGGDTIGTLYGIKIADQTVGSTNYALYTGAGTVRFGDHITLVDGKNISTGTTIGMRIGTSTSQKLGFYNATPVAQPTGTPADASDLASALALVNSLKAKLTLLGLIA